MPPKTVSFVDAKTIIVYEKPADDDFVIESSKSSSKSPQKLSIHIPVSQPPAKEAIRTPFTQVKHLKVDEKDQNGTLGPNDMPPMPWEEEDPAMPVGSYWIRFKNNMMQTTYSSIAQSYSVPSFILLMIRINAFIYATVILTLEAIELPVTVFFTSFNIWAWIGMMTYLAMAITVSLIYRGQDPGVLHRSFPAPLRWIISILYALFATFSLTTVILFIATITSPAFGSPSMYQWFLGINLNLVGFAILGLEFHFGRLPLKNTQWPWILMMSTLYVCWLALATGKMGVYWPVPFSSSPTSALGVIGLLGMALGPLVVFGFLTVAHDWRNHWRQGWTLKQ